MYSVRREMPKKQSINQTNRKHFLSQSTLIATFHYYYHNRRRLVRVCEGRVVHTAAQRDTLAATTGSTRRQIVKGFLPNAENRISFYDNVANEITNSKPKLEKPNPHNCAGQIRIAAAAAICRRVVLGVDAIARVIVFFFNKNDDIMMIYIFILIIGMFVRAFYCAFIGVVLERKRKLE